VWVNICVFRRVFLLACHSVFICTHFIFVTILWGSFLKLFKELFIFMQTLWLKIWENTFSKMSHIILFCTFSNSEPFNFLQNWQKFYPLGNMVLNCFDFVKTSFKFTLIPALEIGIAKAYYCFANTVSKVCQLFKLSLPKHITSRFANTVSKVC